jgi:hypothetical protein
MEDRDDAVAAAVPVEAVTVAASGARYAAHVCPHSQTMDYEDVCSDPADTMSLEALTGAPVDKQSSMTQSVVKMKLRSFCPHPAVFSRLNKLVMDMNRLSAEAYAFGNFHVTRLLVHGEEVPHVDRNFYYRCLVAVATSDVRPGTLGAPWRTSMELFGALRPATQTKIDIRGAYNQAVASLSIVMATMATNHLWTNLLPRLTAYLKWRYPNMRGRKQIIGAVMIDTRADLDVLFARDGKPDARALVMAERVLERAVKAAAAKAAKAEKCAGALQATVTAAGAVGTTAAKAASMRARISKHTETKAKADEGAAAAVAAVAAATAKCARVFAEADRQRPKNVARELRGVMPLPSGAQFAARAHLTLPLYYKMLVETQDALDALDRATAGNGTSTVKPVKKKRFSGRLFTLLPYKHGFTISHIPVSELMFLRLLKDVGLEKFEGDGRGLGAADTHAMWARHCHLNAVETCERRFGYHITTDGCAVSVLMKRQAGAAPPAVDPAALGSISVAEVVGVDPGITDVVTACYNSTGQTKHFSSARYYEQAKFNRSRRRTDAWNRETADVLFSSTDRRTARLQQAGEHIRELLAVLSDLLTHRAARGYRNMRFTRYQQKQKAVEEIGLLIAPRRTDSRRTVVGFGDFSLRNSVVSRKTCGPLQAIRRRLGERPDVVLLAVDEHLTSMTCCACHHRLCNMRGLTTRKTGDGDVRVRRSKVHKVLHCSSSDKSGKLSGCGKTWNRDVNASRNILSLTLNLLAGCARPAVFCRGSCTPLGRSSAACQKNFPPVPVLPPAVPHPGGDQVARQRT